MFLTLEDPRAKIQGSRDPLGVQPVWSRFGRRLVTNLTTVSTAVRGFTTLLLGRYYGERLIGDGAAREEAALPIFLRMEQIAAYARHVGEDANGAILGIQRVKKFMHEQGSKVSIGTDPSGLILSDQKTYGLWGLYSVAARVSGLLEDGPLGLKSLARDFVESEYVPHLAGVERRLRPLLLRGGPLDASRGKPLFKALLTVYDPTLSDAERAFFAAVLRDGTHVEGNAAASRQPRLARMLLEAGDSDADADAAMTRSRVTSLIEEARPVDATLADALERVRRVEALFVPADALFQLLQARNGQRPADIAAHVAGAWGTRVPHVGDGTFVDLVHEIELATSPELTAVMQTCDDAFAAGDYEAAIMAILDWNALVMKARGAAPWLRMQGPKLDVRYRAIEDAFPDGDALADRWRNSYFIDALESVAYQLDGGAA